MFLRQHQPKFKHKYPFLGIYSPKESLNHNSFHFYTEPQPGFQQVSLHRKSARKPITMYYQKIAINQHAQKKQNPSDTSTIIDFQYFTAKRKNQQAEKIVIDRTKMVRESEWVKKYQPTKFIQLLTDDMINRNLLTWIKAWDPIVFNKSTKKKTIMPMMFNRNAVSSKFQKPGEYNYLEAVFNNPRKFILLAGPPGCGKTTLVRVLANHCKYEVVQINASDDRSANNLIRKIEDIAGNNTMRGNKKPPLICLDQIDGIAEGQANGITKVIQYIQTGKKVKKQQNINKQQQTKQKGKTQINFTKAKDSKPKKNPLQQNKLTKKENNNNTTLNRPIIFICNDPFAKSLKQLRSKAHVIYFTQLSQDRVVKRMRQILEKEKVVIQLQVLHKICQICRNDIRSCIGVLELVARQKKLNNKNPKGTHKEYIDIINKMKLSFTKDNQSSINQFLHGLFTKKTQISFQKQHGNSTGYLNIAKYLQTQVFQIYNPSLLMQTFLQNFLNIHGVARKGKLFLRIYEDLINSDLLMKNGFKYNNQLERYHVLPYLGFSCCFDGQDYRKIQFPNIFFQKLRKIKANKQLIKTIYQNIPIQLRVFLNKQSFVGCYLFTIFMAMQTSSTKQAEIIKCVSIMLTYGFTLKKQRQTNFRNSIFSPEIDILVTFGQRKPQILISNIIRTLIQQNYEFFKQRKQMLVDHQLRDNTTAMLNQMHLQSRKKKNHEKEQGLKYKFIEGTGTKISYSITMDYFF